MSLRQQKVVLILEKEEDAYPHKVSKIRMEETHISWIFLTGLYAYKIKKQLKFGKILDFSTLKLRKKFCQKEVVLNKFLCGDMYQGVVKIVKQTGKNGNNMRIVNQEENGRVLEYAVKMLEIPQKYRMDNLLASGKVTLKTIESLTKTLVKFHRCTPTNAKIKNFGYPESMEKKIHENFDTLAKLKTVDPKFENTLILFVKKNKKLFYQRIREDKIREIHGDLYLKNIFILENNKFYLYDRIEFNDDLRYADIAEDVAHLSMDLDYHKRSDLRKHLISQYIAKSSDINLENLVYFLMCYKACIRSKVSLFHAKNETIAKKRIAHIRESKDLLKLAESYLESF
jgi:aminoglycoside phosphotransferase family enzyme